MIKVVIVGESSVGKTSMIERFCHQAFSTDHKATVGADFSSKKLVVSGVDVTLQCWDTAGSERYRSLSTSYFRGCEAAVVVFDVNDEASFGRVSFWIDEVLRSTGLPSTEGFPLFVVGNKIDEGESKRKITSKRAFEVCKGKGLAFIECSAKTGENIEAVFVACAASAIDRRETADRGVEGLAQAFKGGRGASRRSQRISFASSDGGGSGESSCPC